ncbi:MAG: transcriptional repressor [Endomicrobiia bacterium]
MKKITCRQTKQRKIIAEELSKLKTHPTAEELFLLVKKHLPNISLGTVYRNLDFLKKQGKILELDFQENFKRYDACTKNHYHFYCNKCKKIFDIEELETLKKLKNKLQHEINFHITNYNINFYGYCKKCKK